MRWIRASIILSDILVMMERLWNTTPQENRASMNPLEDARQALQKDMDEGNTFLDEAYSEIHEAGPK